MAIIGDETPEKITSSFPRKDAEPITLAARLLGVVSVVLEYENIVRPALHVLSQFPDVSSYTLLSSPCSKSATT